MNFGGEHMRGKQFLLDKETYGKKYVLGSNCCGPIVHHHVPIEISTN